ncbi:MAG: fatty acid desaturase, partial [Bdellovibrionota bacterium]
NPEFDPVYPRIQGSAGAFLLRLTWLTIKRENKTEPSFLPLTANQRRADRLTLGVFALLIGLSLRYDFFLSILAVFLLPRLAIFYLHAFYICYLPHAKAEGGFEKYRVAKFRAFWWRAFTAGQWAHGVHHRWPNLPWHQYHEHIERLAQKEAAL